MRQIATAAIMNAIVCAGGCGTMLNRQGTERLDLRSVPVGAERKYDGPAFAFGISRLP